MSLQGQGRHGRRPPPPSSLLRLAAAREDRRKPRGCEEDGGGAFLLPRGRRSVPTTPTRQGRRRYGGVGVGVKPLGSARGGGGAWRRLGARAAAMVPDLASLARSGVPAPSRDDGGT
uniref:Uncharacterized protein n=1 Tax=Oryza meridionalis TaxID=40149 RepID=A0A0E0EBM4_9ORYZ